MGGFPIEILSQSGQYGDVQNRLRPSPAAQQINEIFLNARDLRRRSMTYERDPLATAEYLLDGSSERVQTAREKNHLLGRERSVLRCREIEIIREARRAVERLEFKRVLLVGSATLVWSGSTSTMFLTIFVTYQVHVSERSRTRTC